MGHPRLSITRSDHHGSTLVKIDGEIDLSTVPNFERELVQSAEEGKALIVDLSEVGFMDSSGIGVLVRISKKMTADDKVMGIVCAQGSVRRVLEVSGLDTVIPVYSDLIAVEG